MSAKIPYVDIPSIVLIKLQVKAIVLSQDIYAAM